MTENDPMPNPTVPAAATGLPDQEDEAALHQDGLGKLRHWRLHRLVSPAVDLAQALYSLIGEEADHSNPKHTPMLRVGAVELETISDLKKKWQRAFDALR